MCDAYNWSHFLTCFFGELCEGLYPFLSVAALWGDGGDVRPAQGLDNVHHGLGLEWVWRNHPWEEVIAPVVTQLRGCWRIADLWDLEGEEMGRGKKRLLICWWFSGAASYLAVVVTALTNHILKWPYLTGLNIHCTSHKIYALLFHLTGKFMQHAPSMCNIW